MNSPKNQLKKLPRIILKKMLRKILRNKKIKRSKIKIKITKTIEEHHGKRNLEKLQKIVLTKPKVI